MKKSTWKVHTIATCETCGWEASDYVNAQAIAAIHAKTKGHRVRGEIGLAFDYDGTELKK